MEKKQEGHQKKIQKITDVMNDDHSKLQTLIDIVIIQDKMIYNLNTKLNAMQKRSVRPNLVITGIIESANENCKTKGEDLFALIT